MKQIMTIGDLRKKLNNTWYQDDQKVVLALYMKKPPKSDELYFYLDTVCEENTSEVHLISESPLVDYYE